MRRGTSSAPRLLRSTRRKTRKGEEDVDEHGPSQRKSPPKSVIVSGTLLDTVVDQSNLFLDLLRDPDVEAQLQDSNSGDYVELPIPAYVGLTTSFTNVKENEKLPILQRDIFQRLQNFVQAKEGMTYVYGPEGFGKSFALYHLFCTLSTYPNNRVLYIPHCGHLNHDCYGNMYAAVFAAFSQDEEFLDRIRPLALDPTDASWDLLLFGITIYCRNNNLTFYAIFDQHDSLNEEARHRPTNLLQWPEDIVGPFFKIVISASANNSDQELTKDTPSRFPFREGLTQKELASWQVKHAFFPNEPSFHSLTELTSNIPYELLLVLLVWKGLVDPTMDQVVRSYRLDRLATLNQAHEKYLKDNGATLPHLKYGDMEHQCMLCMVNNIPLPEARNLVYDRQLFYATPTHHIRPTFPLVVDMVLARLQSGLKCCS